MRSKRPKSRRNPNDVELFGPEPGPDTPGLRQAWLATTPEDVAASDAASAGDRDWFSVHPGETQRIRGPYAGEFRPQTPPGHFLAGVVVTQQRPGFRVRQPIFLPIPATH